MTLRSDNADLRLTEKGMDFLLTPSIPYQLLKCLGRLAGVVSESRWNTFQSTRSALVAATNLLKSVIFTPQVSGTISNQRYYTNHTHRDGQNRDTLYLSMVLDGGQSTVSLSVNRLVNKVIQCFRYASIPKYQLCGLVLTCSRTRKVRSTIAGSYRHRWFDCSVQ